MATYTHTAEADVNADALFGFLAEPRNLPRYFPQMTTAEPEGGETVRVEADVHGDHVEGEAWVRPSPADRRLEWGAEGPDDYHGELRVDESSPGRSRITISLHSVREAEGGEVQDGLERTVEALTRAAEADERTLGPGGPVPQRPFEPAAEPGRRFGAAAPCEVGVGAHQPYVPPLPVLGRERDDLAEPFPRLGEVRSASAGGNQQRPSPPEFGVQARGAAVGKRARQVRDAVAGPPRAATFLNQLVDSCRAAA
nr:SRPBCC family protein [Glycomyces tenuis]